MGGFPVLLFTPLGTPEKFQGNNVHNVESVAT